MIRLSSLLILVGLVLELIVVLETTGETAIAFSFIGMPAIGLGVLLYLLVARRHIAQNSHSSHSTYGSQK